MNKFKTALLPAIPIFVLTILIYVLTKNPFTSALKLQLLLFMIIVLPIYGGILRTRGQSLSSSKMFVYLVVSTVLCLIGGTGWFFSPFFFTLYLTAIMLSFIFSLTVAVGFVLTLVALFSFNIGDVDLVYDYLVVLSLLTTIPLSIYLRKEYLKLKEAQKDILVLEKEQKDYQSKVEEVLANKIVNFAVNLKQPINDLKQLAYLLSKADSKKQIKKDQERMIASSEEALRLLKEFEEGSTGKVLLTNPGISLASQPTDRESDRT